ncbi:hypothetical protein MCM1_2771 [Methanosarcina barkeri CM1]|uniref:Uncharacterized protein n=1 Tax=Methanosarcina barkeri CM1 TaxID=796385 RepID=A0A0G3CGB5_METBA|nr:hypothetical protein MCM1_2771 [Methanosarcina barkeri CM1]
MAVIPSENPLMFVKIPTERTRKCCPVCGSVSLTTKRRFHGQRFAPPVYYCESCDMVFEKHRCDFKTKTYQHYSIIKT